MVMWVLFFLFFISMFIGRVIWWLVSGVVCFRVIEFSLGFSWFIFRLDLRFLVWICCRVLVGVMLGIMF